MIKYPYRIPVIKVEQPLGIFYAASIPAAILLDVSYTIRAELLDDGEKDNFLLGSLKKIKGGQRITNISRLQQIKNYTEEVDASFPNSIILGANYNKNGRMEYDENIRWKIINDNGCLYLEIPSSKKMASIIDGQHRIYGFKESSAKHINMLCSIYLDLPLPYHSEIFTKINMNQKRVDKNLAYNLFQFNMNEGEIKTWSPETLAVYIARILLENENSPLHNKMRLGLANSENTSSISMASIIDGIVSLISTDPENDRSILHKVKLSSRTRSLLSETKTKAPLRWLYVKENDKALYQLILNYFKAIKITFWDNKEINILQKTLGIHALFDFLKELIKNDNSVEHYTDRYFIDLFIVAKSLNFNDPYLGTQTKVRSRMKNILFIICKIKTMHELKITTNEEELLINFLKKNS